MIQVKFPFQSDKVVDHSFIAFIAMSVVRRRVKKGSDYRTFVRNALTTLHLDGGGGVMRSAVTHHVQVHEYLQGFSV